MPTLKQRRAVEKLTENHGNVSRAMLDVGYLPNTAKKPSNLTDSKGFKEVCEEVGLTDMLLTKALVEDIKGKPKRRFSELNLGFEVLGLKKQNDGNVPASSFIVAILNKYETNGGSGEAISTSHSRLSE